jgi:hypothetical protein
MSRVGRTGQVAGNLSFLVLGFVVLSLKRKLSSPFPSFQALIRKMTSSNLVVKPCGPVLVHRTAPESMPDRESRAIRAAQ